MFIIGDTYRRRELHEQFGGQQQGGISTPSQHKIILLFSGTSGQEYGYHDGLSEDKRTFYYTGEGQQGNMAFSRGNLAIRDHEKNGKELHVFYYSAKGMVKYLGQFCYVDHKIVKKSDAMKNERDAIVFELAIVD